MSENKSHDKLTGYQTGGWYFVEHPRILVTKNTLTKQTNHQTTPNTTSPRAKPTQKSPNQIKSHKHRDIYN